VRWGIERGDGTALGIAGLWERWKSPAGEEVLSFAMLTINCDEHPLLKRFHKHFDEKGEPNERRTPALLREDHYDRWLNGSAAEAPSFFSTFGSDDLHANAAPRCHRANRARRQSCMASSGITEGRAVARLDLVAI
jgi:putative SOS response-associated peptidase YedK